MVSQLSHPSTGGKQAAFRVSFRYWEDMDEDLEGMVTESDSGKWKATLLSIVVFFSFFSFFFFFFFFFF